MSVKTVVHTDLTQPRKVSHRCGTIEAAPKIAAATSNRGCTTRRIDLTDWRA